MKYLFVIQGEGRGHLTQAMSMEKMLRARGHEVVKMLVGKSKSRTLPAFFTNGVNAPIAYFDSINFVPTAQNKRPDAFKTLLFNLWMRPRILRSLYWLRKELKKTDADVIVNFYEIMASVAYDFIRRPAPMICIGHQFVYLHEDYHFPIFGYEGHIALNIFSWTIAKSATKTLALSLRPMKEDKSHNIKVVPPLLRPEVAELKKGADFKDGDYILGYMLNAGFSEEVIKWHNSHPDVPLHFFWDKLEEAPVKKIDDTLSFYYLDDKEFLRQMAGCKAYASTAGFESVCEAMYLGKPLMTVPSHIEQECNAYDASLDMAAIPSKEFNLDLLLKFSKEGFVRNEQFPEWVDSAARRIVWELEHPDAL